MMVNDYGKNDFGFSSPQSVYIDDVIRALKADFNRQLLDNPIHVGDQQIKLVQSPTGNDGKRFWFVCPACSIRVGRLIFSEQRAYLCRHCSQHTYPSSRFKGMPEDIARGLHG